jgi:hypothetical protein
MMDKKNDRDLFRCSDSRKYEKSLLYYKELFQILGRMGLQNVG